MIAARGSAAQLIKSGKLRPLAVTGSKRHAVLPEVPTFEELGFSGFTAVQWYGIVGPAKMPLAVVSRLNEEINRAIAVAGAARATVRRGAGADADEQRRSFRPSLQAEVARWTKLVRERNSEHRHQPGSSGLLLPLGGEGWGEGMVAGTS